MKNKKSKTKSTPHLGIAVSLGATAATTGLSIQLIQLAKARGCKAFKQNGRCDCDKLLEWLGENQIVLEDAGVLVDRDFEITLRAKAERELREHRLGVLRGEYVLTEDVERDTANLILAAKAVLLSGPSSLAPQLVGVSIPEAESILKHWLHAALTRLSANPLGKKD